MTDPVIRSIPLDRLELSPANVRKTRGRQDRLRRTQGFHRIARAA